jgi:hypothetical protein
MWVTAIRECSSPADVSRWMLEARAWSTISREVDVMDSP